MPNMFLLLGASQDGDFVVAFVNTTNSSAAYAAELTARLQAGGGAPAHKASD